MYGSGNKKSSKKETSKMHGSQNKKGSKVDKAGSNSNEEQKFCGYCNRPIKLTDNTILHKICLILFCDIFDPLEVGTCQNQSIARQYGSMIGLALGIVNFHLPLKQGQRVGHEFKLNMWWFVSRAQCFFMLHMS